MIAAKKVNKTIGIRYVTYICLIGLWLLVLLIQSREAYCETKKISGTAEDIAVLAINRIPIDNSPYKGNFYVYHSVLVSADPDWNNAHFFYIQYDEPTKEWDERGYGAISHPNGDQTFIKFVNKWESATGFKLTGERKGVFIGGTGKFNGIKASWLCKWIYNKATGKRLDEWEVEYAGD